MNGDKTKISYEELIARCNEAIKDGKSRNWLYMELRKEKRIISEIRLNLMWTRCGGSLRNKGGQ